MPRRLQTYVADEVTVTFDPTRCVHAAECIRALPEVFDTRRARWIRPERASADDVVRAVERCPTGALHYQRAAGDAERAADGPVRVQASRDGALYVRGEVTLVAEDGTPLGGGLRFALCRCGASRAQPFCDGSHRRAGFFDPP